MAGVRLAVLDDGSFVRTYARDTRPLSATFNRFVEAVAGTRAFEHVRYIVPVRHLRIWEEEPALDPIDESVLEIVPTTFFSGIADYVLRSGYIVSRNWTLIDRAIAESDLLWLRLPASNALIALAAARRHRVPYFGWVAGSVRSVVAAQKRPPPLRIAADALAKAYDAVTALAGRGGPLITLDGQLFASVISDAEVGDSEREASGVPGGPPWRVVWAGRMAGGKALADLIEGVNLLVEEGLDVSLVLVGDGPARPSVRAALSRLPPERVEDHGYVGDRTTYMDLLRHGHVLAHPSQAEGVPKVLVEAMAAGVPIVAADAGAVADVLGRGERGRLVRAGDPAGLARAIAGLLGDESERGRLRQTGLRWAREHTARAQADRLVAWMRTAFPHLDWPAGS